MHVRAWVTRAWIESAAAKAAIPAKMLGVRAAAGPHQPRIRDPGQAREAIARAGDARFDKIPGVTVLIPSLEHSGDLLRGYIGK